MSEPQKRSDRLLSEFLGLEKPDGSERSIEEKTRMDLLLQLKDDTAPNASEKSIVDRVWQAIDVQYQEKAERSLVKRLLDFAFNPKVLYPALACLMLAIGFIGYTKVLTRPQDFFVVFSGKIGKHDVNLARMPFVNPTGEAVRANFEFGEILLNGAKTMRGKRTMNEIFFELGQGQFYFNYEISAKRPSLTIKTPLAEYLVTGTKFAVDIRPEGEKLFVLEGSVRAKNVRGATATVPADFVWEAEKGLLREDKKGVAETVHSIIFANNNELSGKKNPSLPSVRVYMLSGEIMSGTLLAENPQNIEIEITGLNRKLKIPRDQIAKIAR